MKENKPKSKPDSQKNKSKKSQTQSQSKPTYSKHHMELLDTESENESEETENREKKEKEEKKRKKQAKKARAPAEAADTEEVEDTNDDDEDSDSDEDYDPNEDKGGAAKDIIIVYGDESAYDDEEEDIEKILNDEDEECNSDDEQIFMKENYEKVDAPALPFPFNDSGNNPENSKKNGGNGKNQKHKHKHNHNHKHKKAGTTGDASADSEKATPPPTATPEQVEEEYKDLLELKKQLTEKLKKKTNSRILLKAIEECKKDIHQLVLKTRRKNAKEYHELTTQEKRTRQSELEYFKNKLSHKEQVKIMKDLKDVNSYIFNDKPYRLTLLQSNIPPKYKATVMQKLNMMMTMEPGDSEYHKLKSWVDSFFRIPFGVYHELSISMKDGLDKCDQFMCNARKTLDDCVFGLDDAKMQILQLAGQWLTNPHSVGSSIAICGPPGTGKTSIARNGISKIFGREFAFISLGGAGDASFLDGMQYTYEGSTYGRIAQILMESKCMNPVIYFDELDKVSDSARGQEIIGLLTHLTDSTQNSEFHDKYFADTKLDLSKCLFIFSYNDANLINPILRDRMYQIQTKGYDAKEKLIIAKKYMLPKIREQVNFQEGEIVIPDDVIQYIISSQQYTQNEEGVRNLKRCLEIIHTKLNMFRLMHPNNSNIEYILGKECKLNVTFPYEVSRQDVDVLLKSNNKQPNQSLLAMYV